MKCPVGKEPKLREVTHTEAFESGALNRALPPVLRAKYDFIAITN